MITLQLMASTLAAASAIGLPNSTGLRDLARGHRLVFGTAAPISALRSNADSGKFVDVLTSQFNLVEPENDLKPPAIWTGPREYKFGEIDWLLGEPGKKGWAQEHKMKVRGHVLIYARDDGYTVSQWLRSSEKDLSKEQASELLHDYIFALAGRYKGKIAMWDVANEAIDDGPNNNPFNLRNSFWFRKLGPEFLVLAFKWAHEADPKAELYYNDYGIESGGTKGKHVLDLVKWLKEQKAPIHGVGMQYHIDCRTKVEPGGPFYAYVEEIRKLKLAYMVTELDVAVPVTSLPFGDPNRGTVPKDPADLDAQAQVYTSVVKMALASKNCHGVNIWGLTDKHSWIPMISRGRTGAATLYSKDYEPKPAYNALVELLKK